MRERGVRRTGNQVRDGEPTREHQVVRCEGMDSKQTSSSHVPPSESREDARRCARTDARRRQERNSAHGVGVPQARGPHIRTGNGCTQSKTHVHHAHTCIATGAKTHLRYRRGRRRVVRGVGRLGCWSARRGRKWQPGRPCRRSWEWQSARQWRRRLCRRIRGRLGSGRRRWIVCWGRGRSLRRIRRRDLRRGVGRGRGGPWRGDDGGLLRGTMGRALRRQ